MADPQPKPEISLRCGFELCYSIAVRSGKFAFGSVLGVIADTGSASLGYFNAACLSRVLPSGSPQRRAHDRASLTPVCKSGPQETKCWKSFLRPFFADGRKQDSAAAAGWADAVG